MNVYFEQGKWICGEGAGENIPRLAAAMHSAFAMKAIGNPDCKLYKWWMSCESVAKTRLMSFEVNRIDDFRREYLDEANTLLLDSGRESLISLGEAKVYCDIIATNENSVRIFRDAISLVNSAWSDWQKSVFQSLIQSIVPIFSTFDGSERGVGFTDHNFMGAIFVSVERSSPYPDIALNISFAHELGHLAFMVYQFSSTMLFDTKDWVYSGVRKVDRPALKSFHAAVALGYMLACSKSLLNSTIDVGRKAYIQALIDSYTISLSAGLNALEKLPKSKIAEEIFKDLKAQL